MATTAAAWCPKCKRGFAVGTNCDGHSIRTLTCGDCKGRLEDSPITVDFCIWLQNEWAEEIRTIPPESG